MKLTTFLLIIALVQASASGFAQKISLNETNAPLEKVISAIKQQSGYVFLYTDQGLKDEKITVRVAGAGIEETLKAAFKNTTIDYKVVGNNILLKKAEKIEPNFIDQAKAFFAAVVVSGKVVDETGQPMIGVTVKIKNTNLATSTDAKGAYSITVADDKTILVFSFIGYESIELAAKDIQAGSTITLKTAAENLREVVISKGYYSVKQLENTGNVSVVSGDDIRKQPVSDPILALESRVPGLQINQTSGISGSNVTVRLRGQNSLLNGNNPLYIVDGVPFTSTSLLAGNSGQSGGALNSGNILAIGNKGLSPFNLLDPSNIESIEVLKDADATAIYGSRGANGVILITTKSGKAGSTRIDFNINTGWSEVARKIPLLNTQQYLKMRHDAIFYDKGVVGATDYDLNGSWDTTRYTDWQKTFIGKTARSTNANLSISGGNSNTQFLIGGSYSTQGMVFPGDFGDKKASMSLNVNHTSSNHRFKLGLSSQYLNENNLVPNEDFTAYINLAPDAPSLYDNSGNINWQNGTWANPIANTLVKFQATVNGLISSMVMSYEIAPGLQLSTNLGYTKIQTNQTNQIPATAAAPPNNTNPTSRSNFFATTNLTTLIAEPKIAYDAKIGKGKFSGIIGFTLQKNDQNTLGQLASGFSSDALIPNIGAASTIISRVSDYNQYRYNALFGRFGYNWDDRYLINITARRDGSSRFGPENQFGNFGSIGAAWIFSSEKWIENTMPFLNLGKLRASYGWTGSDQTADYGFMSTYNVTTAPYQGSTGLAPSNLTNPYFGWEVTKKMEVGIDLTLLKNRIQVGIDYYRNRSSNQLVSYPLPSQVGFTSIQANLPAVVQNSGIESNISTINIKTHHFTWQTFLNLTVSKNKLIDYPDLANSPYSSNFAIGQPLSINRLYHFTGVDAATGVYQFEDVNKDGQITDVDRQFTTAPRFQNYFGGIGNTFSYKNLQLDLFFQVVKQNGYDYIAAFGVPGLINSNQPSDLLNRWQKPGDLTTIGRSLQGAGSNATLAVQGYSNARNTSDYFITDASFIRLKTLAVTYALPAGLLTRFKCNSGRIYLQCQNLLTITGYKGIDPESQGLVLPPLRTVSMGIQISL